ncbi:MAG: CoA-binding protein [Chlorobi bacterium]|nr:CoA-binding protein [Chlorobiota bacterium]
MKKVTKKAVDDFLNQLNYAFVGVSRKEKHFANTLYSELKKRKFNLTPINPNIEDFKGEKCYPDLKSVPKKIDAVILTTPKAKTLKVIQQVYDIGIKHVWIQQGAQTKEAIQFAEEKKLNIIANKCLYMFANPLEGGHKFHRNFNNFFGILPK